MSEEELALIEMVADRSISEHVNVTFIVDDLGTLARAKCSASLLLSDYQRIRGLNNRPLYSYNAMRKDGKGVVCWFDDIFSVECDRYARTIDGLVTR